MDDVVSDFSAIHGIRDVMVLPGPVFFALAYRLPAYPGMMQARLRAEVADGDPPPPRQQQQQRRGPDRVPATRTALRAHPEMSRLISFGSPKGAR